MITDSFGLTVIPYLTYNYGQIHYYDARYYDRATLDYTVVEMIEKYEIQDIYMIVADFHALNGDFVIESVYKHLHG